MPKIKTNKTAYKKFRVTASGKIKRAQAYTSHNTAKHSPKTSRNLRDNKYVADTDYNNISGLIPYLIK